MRWNKILVLSGLSVLLSCNSQPKQEEVTTEPKSGIWRATIALNDSIKLPFNFKLQGSEEDGYTLAITNADETIIATDISVVGNDTLKIQMPVFANYLLLQKGEEKMTGYYVNPDAENYLLPLEAVYGVEERFEADQPNCCDINKKWAVKFSPQTEKEDPAIGYFEQEGSKVKGTFMTETGDYRYLQGVLSGDKLQLSTFDGSHLYYFDATIENGQEMNGRYFSGRSHYEPWMAYRDDDFELSDPDTLTYIKEGYEGLSFAFPNLNGDTISLNDDRFDGKALIIQIMGSWCPNCMDESRYLRGAYEKYHQQGLEVVGLTFERVKDRETATIRAKKMVKDLDIPYAVLLAGATREDRAADALPMLNHIMSFPTSVYLDRNHQVVKIHTGFSGPGTPVYDSFVRESDKTIKEMLNTKSAES